MAIFNVYFSFKLVKMYYIHILIKREGKYGCRGQQSYQKHLDCAGPSYFLSIICWDPKVFPGETTDMVPPGFPDLRGLVAECPP